VLRFAQFLTHASADADDLAQETLLKAFTRTGRLEAGSNVKAWLLTILRNTWLDRRRTAASRPQLALADLPAEPSAEKPSDNDQWSHPREILDAFSDDQIIAALKQLPDDIRWTLLLVDVQGLDQQDTAQILDVPIGTVKSRAHRGRGMLRTLLLPMARDRGWVRGDPTTASVNESPAKGDDKPPRSANANLPWEES